MSFEPIESQEQLDAILRDNQTTTTLQKKKEDLERRIATERKALADYTANKGKGARYCTGMTLLFFWFSI